MILITEAADLNSYLQSSPLIDLHDPLLIQKAHELFEGVTDETQKIRIAFEFVRDQIPHSWDIKSHRVTRNSHEVLLYREGICYAKSMLLAALLRSQGIPTGFCVQRVTLGETDESGYCLHALNAVYISSAGRWHRIDARGNSGSINAQFCLDHEQLAFPIREEYGEVDYPQIYAELPSVLVKTLEENDDCFEMYLHGLPSELPEENLIKIQLVRAVSEDSALLIETQNAVFYDDFVTFGECPAYNESPQTMRELIENAIVYKIMIGERLVGDMIIRRRPKGEYYLRVLAILPEAQGLHVGSRALELLFDSHPDAVKWTLITPKSRARNCHFYEKMGFVKMSEEVHSPILTLNHYEKRMN